MTTPTFDIIAEVRDFQTCGGVNSVSPSAGSLYYALLGERYDARPDAEGWVTVPAARFAVTAGISGRTTLWRVRTELETKGFIETRRPEDRRWVSFRILGTKHALGLK